MTRYVSIRFAACGLVLFALSSAFAQFNSDDVPTELEGVEIIEHLNETIPTDLEFVNDQGESVKLGDYLTDGKPIIITPVYYNCPQLCTLVLNGLMDGLRDVQWKPGREFHIVSYTVAEEETVDLAEKKKRGYISRYELDEYQDGWHFLTGSKENIEALSEAVGFKFNRQEDGLIAHSASIVFVTPDGRISRYMNDVLFEPRDLNFALIEASQGNIGSPMERFLLFNCFIYDPDKNSYVASAIKIMRLGGFLTLIIVCSGLFVLWIRGSRAEEQDRLIIEGGSVT